MMRNTRRNRGQGSLQQPPKLSCPTRPLSRHPLRLSLVILRIHIWGMPLEVLFSSCLPTLLPSPAPTVVLHAHHPHNLLCPVPKKKKQQHRLPALELSLPPPTFSRKEPAKESSQIADGERERRREERERKEEMAVLLSEEERSRARRGDGGQ